MMAHVKTRLRYLKRRLLRLEVVAGVVVFLAGAGGAFLVSFDSFRVSNVEFSEVTATAEFSTGAVQGSKNTLASYSFKGEEFHVLAKGGPYFEGDEFALAVDEDGKVITPSSIPIALMMALMGFIIFGSIAFMVWLFIFILIDPI